MRNDVIAVSWKRGIQKEESIRKINFLHGDLQDFAGEQAYC